MASSYSVVIPVYKGAQHLPELIERLTTVLGELGGEYEVLMVEDGSPDESWDVIEQLSDRHARVRGISLYRNYGQHNALLCGVRAARNEVVITLDDDLQHPPEEIPKLLAELEKGHDVVYGVPQVRSFSLTRNAATWAAKMALRSVIGSTRVQDISAFRAFHRALRDGFAEYRAPLVSLDVLLSWTTARFSSVLVRHDPRKHTRTTYTFRKLVVHTLNLLTGFTTWPLRLASLTGFAITLFGVGVLIYVLGRYFIEGGSVPGFPFLASSMAIFSGAQLFALGVIGEYLSRMYVRSMDQPAYMVRAQTGLRAAAAPGVEAP